MQEIWYNDAMFERRFYDKVDAEATYWINSEKNVKKLSVNSRVLLTNLMNIKDIRINDKILSIDEFIDVYGMQLIYFLLKYQ